MQEVMNFNADVGDLHSFADSVYLSIQGKEHDEKSAKFSIYSRNLNDYIKCCVTPKMKLLYILFCFLKIYFPYVTISIYGTSQLD